MSTFSDRMRFRSDHRWAPGQMSAYVDAELDSSQRRRMEQHLGECRECRALLAGLRRMLDALQRLPASPDSPGSPDPLQIAASVRLRLGEPPAS